MIQRRSWRALGTRARTALTPSFWAGVLVGCGLTLSLWRPSVASNIDEPFVVPVRGEGSVDELRQAPRSSSHTVASAGPVLPAPELARRALAITAFVRGGGMYGAGFAISDRHVLTCLHVVENLSEVEVAFEQGPRARARVVERDRALDLAVLELDPPAKLEPAQLASASTARMGEPIYAMGAPRKMSFSFSTGTVSYVGRLYDGVRFLQADLTSNSGSSGGPWLDSSGRVVAMSSFILRDSQGLAFALPIDYAYRRFGKYFSAPLDVGSFESWLEEPSVERAATNQAER